MGDRIGEPDRSLPPHGDLCFSLLLFLAPSAR
jgi:hypothetical protein